MNVRPDRLKTLAGVIWVLVGGMLLVRSVPMIASASERSGWGPTITAIVVGLVLGAGKGRFVLAKIARRNRRRIEALATARPWHVFTPKTWLLVVGMIGLGLLLRGGAAAGWLPWMVVAAIYAGVGAAMLVSSWAYFRAIPPPLPTRIDGLGVMTYRHLGVLVVNLGTPDAPTPAAVRRYLREFLGDRRVVEVWRWLWFLILNGIILPLRSPRSARLYQRVWGHDGSPLLTNSQAFAHALSDRLGDRFVVRLAMRYGNPSLGAGLDLLRSAGCERVIVVPLFPQSSNTTTGTVQAEVARLSARRRDPPALQFLGPLYQDRGYIQALAERIRRATDGAEVQFHVFSFHGLPEAYVQKGDPYLCHCSVTAVRLAEELGLAREQWEMVFQSQFGDEPWLQPFADEFVPALAKKYRRVAMSLPGFAADCLETLEEIGMQLQESFEQAGGEELIVVPALNDHPMWVEAVAQNIEGPGGVGRQVDGEIDDLTAQTSVGARVRRSAPTAPSSSTR